MRPYYVGRDTEGRLARMTPKNRRRVLAHARAVKASREAQRQTEKLVQALTKVDVDDALRIGEVFRLHVKASTLLEDELSDMALWTGDEEAERNRPKKIKS